MRPGLALRLIGLLGVALAVRPACAMQFEQKVLSATEVVIIGRGQIVPGDAARLAKAVAAVAPGKRLLILALDSPGGTVLEGERLAHLIRARGLPVLIPSDSKCVSACFLLLAASPRRFVAADALVGVHSASEAGQETGTSLAVTTLMARDAAELGIPPAIIGKMVQTTPGRVEWLTRADLLSMNVTVYDGDVPDTGQPRVGPAAPAPVQAPVSVPAPPAVVPGFAAGADDRRAWDAWMAGLHGPYGEGAAFARAQLAAPQPVPCGGPNGASLGDFTQGCVAARQRLARVETGMRGHPDYLAGWNGGAQGGPKNEPVEAEYRGAYFCGRQAARLNLKVFPNAGATRRRALFSFGPQPASPDVPPGAFLVEGDIGLNGGAMILTPVEWVSRPAGYAWLGLSGRSEDGGRTFAGRVTDGAGCSMFTLQRVSEATATR